jgi:HK97 gp10 family phage protein
MARGPRKIKWYGKQVIQKLNAELFVNIERAARHFESELKDTLSQPGSGRKYKRKKGRGQYVRGAKKGQDKVGMYHVASAPGEPPAADMGFLRRSVFINIYRNELKARIGVRTKYVRHLEFGTKTMRPRPYLHPTFRKNKKYLTAIIAGKK